MPEMGESVTEGTVLEWHVSEGDSVEEGQTMVEVSTDKVDAEVPAPASGTVTKILVQPDETVEVGKALAEIDPNGAGRARQRVRASATAASQPAARGRDAEEAAADGEAGVERRGGRDGDGDHGRRIRVGRQGPGRRPGRDRDARDGRVRDRGNRARVARRRGRRGRGRADTSSRSPPTRSTPRCRPRSQRDDRRRSWCSPTRRSRSASRWPRWRRAPAPRTATRRRHVRVATRHARRRSRGRAG